MSPERVTESVCQYNAHYPLVVTNFSRLLSCSLSIKKTSTPFEYELVLKDVYEEGDEEGASEEEIGDWDAEDMEPFTLDEDLNLAFSTRNGRNTIVWADTMGEIECSYEFTCKSGTSAALLKKFTHISKICQWEHKHQMPGEKLEDKDLGEFDFKPVKRNGEDYWKEERRQAAIRSRKEDMEFRKNQELWEYFERHPI